MSASESRSTSSHAILLRHEVGRSHRTTSLSLVFLFISAFLIPLVAGGVLISFRGSGSGKEDVEIFPDNIPAQAGGAYLRIGDSEFLKPLSGEDFLVSIWFNFRRIPAASETMMLYSKTDEARLPSGYSLSLERVGSAIRPVVFWKDQEGKGGTYRFEDMRLPLRVWINFVLTYSEDNKLGLNAIFVRPGEKPIRLLLGGYKLSVPVYPVNRSDLIVGSLNRGTFRGAIGPMLIARGRSDSVGLGRNLRTILKSLGKNTSAVPPSLGKDSIMFWSPDGKADKSGHNHSVIKSKVIERLQGE